MTSDRTALVVLMGLAFGNGAFDGSPGDTKQRIYDWIMREQPKMDDDLTVEQVIEAVLNSESAPTEAEQAFHRPTWKAALTLAHNLCAQYSNRHNDNDETEQADALNEMCGHIKPYLDCTDEEIAEMVAEANPSSYVQQSIQQEKP